MTAIETDELFVVTGPLTHDGELGWVRLAPGEVVQVVERPWPSLPHVIRVLGFESGETQWIDSSSLTALSQIHNIHDYVHEEDNDA